MRPSLPFVALLAVSAACHGSNSTPEIVVEPPADPVVNLGDPQPGLTADEKAAFDRGRAIFLKRFTPGEGLGPLYNATSCKSCHSKPVPGGGADLYRNFYVAAVGVAPFQSPLPGLPSQVIPAFGSQSSPLFTLDGRRTDLPTDFFGAPVVVGQRNSIPMFGVGLFEFVSNTTILSHADPDDADGDGISGRVNNDGAGLGRFGTKAQSNSIEFFTRAPLKNQMGITSNPFLGAAGTVSLAPGLAQGTGTPNAPTTDDDGVPDPEISPQDLGDLIAFTRFLAPPQPQKFDDAATRGEKQFADLGCVKCHIPELPSSRGPVRAYTDILIHDMGPGLAEGINFGIPQASATSPTHTGSEWRTAPLWGVSKFGPWLHDGRASTLDDAIRAHGGEALAIREAYVALTESQRADVLAFLGHL